ncbi:hypothetical protein BXY85_0449 [Roseivirga pacifica]|uniref:Uncharacterized protein n=1 Tax=Roseivirga pacifica TaxID=1267423 RepID=A0A1I0RSB0_9BACT|nr:DUF5908 family protein [Roseivirga pacifica]RKQ49460.1 hypothetical protein BXY85_0449 [Roseivirga pacifica]SEW44129.1 hypothetical protein SAMN05216290_4038 [Roseivirga pacifica]|tara:strand:+ start:139 stop:315 length:177 start_codon:yes stop_codon:yes gene_type:complete
MPIEIRELIIKTTIEGAQTNGGQLSNVDLSNLKHQLRREVMSECKQLIETKLREEKER